MKWTRGMETVERLISEERLDPITGARRIGR